MFKKLLVGLGLLSIGIHAYAGPHDLCGIYIDIINNSAYDFTATGIGSGGNEHWDDAGGFNTYNTIPAHSRHNTIYTNPAHYNNNYDANYSYQFFDLYPANQTSKKNTFQITILDSSQSEHAAVRLTDKSTGFYIDTNYILSWNLGPQGIVTAPHYTDFCPNRMKPWFKIIIDGNGNIEDQEILAGAYKD